MKSAEIREAYLRFFESKGHTRVPSSSLVPDNDPTLLFTNAGMNQFKNCFLGLEKRPYKRATTSQKCVRAGGKHNDLENVGYTARHHTFFEMLGNFSFGDYFKKDAISYAWEFLTSPNWLGLPKEKLWVTIYANDDEAFEIWTKQEGVAADRVIRIGDNKGAPYASDNFWAMGDTGPCGPCTEIFYDHGPEIWGGLPGSPEEDGDRYVEIWNVVFMQFNRSADGQLCPLPAPSVDTGMGLERISAVMQHVHANYEIDSFVNLLKASAEAIGCVNDNAPSLKVVADHIRSCSFLIADGVLPSNEGRGYVLRRIIRRACRHGNKLGAKGAFFYKIVAALVAEMGNAYPELKTNESHIARVLKTEEEQFAKTLDQGLRILEQDLAALPGTTIPGEVIFKLYDTYGFPVDLTNDIARERNLSLDEVGFQQKMQEQQARAKSASNFAMDYNSLLALDTKTEFTGYQQLIDESKIVIILKDNQQVDELAKGDNAALVLDKTPFYAESGGQVGDTGYLFSDGVRFEVTHVTKVQGAFLHHGVLAEGHLHPEMLLNAVVDDQVRHATALNHSATHLLHAALRQVLGEHVHQKGSLVDSQRLRFDFSHFEAVTHDELVSIEQIVNEQIRLNSEVKTEITDIETAKKAGAMALFGEKYGDTVRVLSMGEGFSIELCGGTHTRRTGDIGLFKIIGETGIAAGVRRIEAVTAKVALDYLTHLEDELTVAASLLKGTKDNVLEKLKSLLEHNRLLEKELAQTKGRLASAAGSDLLTQAVTINGTKVLAARVDGQDNKALLVLLDQLKNKLASGIILLASELEGKVVLVAGVTDDLTNKFKAGDLIKRVCEMVAGKGGGRPSMAQGSGSDVSKIDEALALARAYVEQTL